MQQAIQQGIQNEKRAIAKHLLEKDAELSFIEEVTGLSLEEIKNSRKSLSNHSCNGINCAY